MKLLSTNITEAKSITFDNLTFSIKIGFLKYIHYTTEEVINFKVINKELTTCITWQVMGLIMLLVCFPIGLIMLLVRTFEYTILITYRDNTQVSISLSDTEYQQIKFTKKLIKTNRKRNTVGKGLRKDFFGKTKAMR